MMLPPGLDFARPWWLLALLPLAWAFWRGMRNPPGTSRWLRVVDPYLLPHVLTGTPQRLGIAALALGSLLAVLALAGPVLQRADGRHATRGDSLRVLVVDLSPGAAAQLERVKLKLHALLKRPYQGDTALLVYAAEPYLVVPPTGDARVVAHFVPELAIDAMPAAGNQPRNALRMAVAVFERSRAATGDIVWFGGADWNDGSAEPGRIRLSVLHTGNAVAPALGQAVARSGGILLPMRADDTDLNLLADTMRISQGRARTAGGTDLGPWLLLPLLPLAALCFRRNQLAAVALLACTILPPDTAMAAGSADAEARKLFDAGRFAEAARAFSDPRWKAAAQYRAGRFDEAARLLEGLDDPDSLYNRANALAKTGRLQEALAGYEASLQARPGDADTLHNRDLVRSLLNNPKSGGGRSGGPLSPSAAEADRAAEQWMRGVPDDPGSLLRRKLQAEHRRRLAGEAERLW